MAGGELLRAASYASGGNEFLVRVLIGNWSIKTVLQILTHTHTLSVYTHTQQKVWHAYECSEART